MKKISLIWLIAGFPLLFCYGQHSDTTIYINPEIQPVFQYDTNLKLKESVKKYFMDNYKMPDILLNREYSGTIYVEFIIEKDSTVNNVKLLRGIDYQLDKTIVETIKSMPKWSPGIDKGEIVRTRLVLPIFIHWLYGINY